MIQLGPVQDFIAAAKTTRDLWSGSYMLSYLMASIINYTQTRFAGDVRIIFPNPYSGDGEPTAGILKLLSNDAKKTKSDDEGYLLPTLPNKLLLKIKRENLDAARGVAMELEQIPVSILKDIGKSVMDKFGQAVDAERFDIQLNSFLEIYWAIVEIEENNFSKSYKKLSKIVAAAKNLRVFSARNKSWIPCGGISGRLDGNEKDFLTGKDENVILSCQKIREAAGYKDLIRENEKLGAINLIKRLWHKTYLCGVKKLPEEWFAMPGSYDIAKGNLAEDSSESEKEDINKYYAVIAFDGDKIGKWVSGDMLKEPAVEFESYLKSLSYKLNGFTEVAKKVLAKYGGKLIYAGGDDVLALLPTGTAIACAENLHKEFSGMELNNAHFEGSCGMAIGHVKNSVQDLVKQAQLSEKDAKNVYGRNALSIHILKRSGEIIKWGGKFVQSPNFEFLKSLISLKKNSGISEKFIYDFIKVLNGYVSNGTKKEAFLKRSETAMILNCELEVAMRSKPISPKVKEGLRETFNEVVSNMPARSEFSERNFDIETLISLFQVAAWVEQGQNEN